MSASPRERSPSPSEDEDEGIDLRPGAGSPGDSSEEEATDSEEERAVRKDFIVDEDESERRRRRRLKEKKRRERKERAARGEADEEGAGRESSRKRRKDHDDDEDEALDEDDLELLQENLGIRTDKPKQGKLRRLRRARSASPGDDTSARAPRGLQDIFADEDAGPAAGVENLFDADEMAGFIEDDTDESRSEAGDSDEDRAARKGRKKRDERRKRAETAGARRRGGFAMGRVEGMTAEAWGEVAEVFGNGQDYAWAMELDDEEEDKPKELKDIFEPSEIASRMLTEEDEKIRTTDVPERQQLASVGLPPFEFDAEGALLPLIPEAELPTAAVWMADKLPRETTAQFLLRDDDGRTPPLHDAFLSAIQNVVKFINNDFLEPPHIWNHRSDYLFHAPAGEDPVALLTEDDVWRISQLSIKFRAFLARKKEVASQYASIGTVDVHLEEVMEQAASVEEMMDAQGWLGLKYANRLEEAKKTQKEEGGENGAAGEQDDEERARVERAAELDRVKRPKRATIDNEYQTAKKTVIRRLAELINISPGDFALDVIQQQKTHFAEDPDKSPLDLADEFVVDPEFPTRQAALAAAKMVLVTELGHEPLLRKEARRFFKDFAVVNVAATKAGEAKIDVLNPYYAFKYLKNKPVNEFTRSAQWLQILAAEAEGLVTASIDLPQAAYDKLMFDFSKMYLSDYTSAIADEWNKLREEILKQAVDEYLLPQGAAWTRGWVKEESEEAVADACQRRIESRIDVAPWCRQDDTMEPGETPSVLALSNGRGDPKRDSVVGVFLDSDGHFREHFKFDTIAGDMDQAQREQFTEFLKRRRPQVVVVGGFSPTVPHLLQDFRVFAEGVSTQLYEDGAADDEEADEGKSPEEVERRKRNRAAFESAVVYDEIAKIYQNSQRAAQEFTELSTLGKYCVGLARYTQSPLNEYAALGQDLTALSYDPNQKYLTKDKLVQALERSLVSVTNRVGVDINRATRDPYYAHLLPYVSGLGLRKADACIKKVNAIGGTLTTRTGLIMQNIVTKNIFLNVAGFLRIRQDDLAADLELDIEGQENPDILDDTRIHPEDYDVARKMASDAMEYDEEDLEGAAPSKAVADLLDDDVRKLDELALDEFADELSKVLGQPKRLTLHRIREELQKPFHEKRPPFKLPGPEERFTMFTGETRNTLDQGLILPVRVLRVTPDDAVIARLDCGINGTIEREYRTNSTNITKLRPGQTLQAMIISVDYANFSVNLTTQENMIEAGDTERRQVKQDVWFDKEREAAEKRIAQQQSQRQAGKTKRVINHPNYQDISAGKAEEYLANMQRGDCVIRPSSREDHIAVTWKVAEGIYQHIAVHELNKPNAYSLGTQLRIDDKHRYSDLDELIDAHIKQMARKVNELTSNERFKGTKEQLEKFLSTWTNANPGKSIYAFGWESDRRKAGQVVLGFKTNEKSGVQYWPVFVVPEGYMLKGSVHGDIPSLINAFKIAYSSGTGGARVPNLAPGRTPYGAGAAGATPNAYGRTPNPHLNPQQGGRTPINYGQPAYGTGRTPQPGPGVGVGVGAGMGYGGGRTPGYPGPGGGQYAAPPPAPYATGYGPR
ncbi:transcription elongation factor SPT6 [Rhodotorula toruloides]|uniref:Transcription elongation factor Spt6 n=1 Tax=Rhodotorula toruloides TaxID=5286 RepID=A0A511KCR8_RHOTO|nr:transcription elongation factor SPT6 [Rhodotorula toruloides]